MKTAIQTVRQSNSKTLKSNTGETALDFLFKAYNSENCELIVQIILVLIQKCEKYDINSLLERYNTNDEFDCNHELEIIKVGGKYKEYYDRFDSETYNPLTRDDKKVLHKLFKFITTYTNDSMCKFLENFEKKDNEFYVEIYSKYFVNKISMEQLENDYRLRKANELLHMENDVNHKINETRFQKWTDLQCHAEAKQLAKKIKENTTHISWKEFIDKCHSQFDRFIQAIKSPSSDNTYESFCFLLPSEMSRVNIIYKSNYWMILLFYDYLKTKNLNIKFQILIFKTKLLAKDITTIIEAHLDDKNNTIFVGIDDVSYSGEQLVKDYLPTFEMIFEKYTFYMIFPYISESTIGLLNDKIYYTNPDSNFKIFYDTESVLKKIDEKILDLSKLTTYFPNTRDFSAYSNANNFLYYFDHKIADYKSTLPSIYQAGVITTATKSIDNKTDENLPYDDDLHYDDLPYDANGKYQKNHCDRNMIFHYPFLENCHNKKVKITDLGEVAKEDPGMLCVVPLYKKKIPN